MKKSKVIELVLVSSLLVSCYNDSKKKSPNVYMRSDSTATYAKVNTHQSSGVGNALLWYYAFRPHGTINSSGIYNRTGFHSSSIPTSSNVGTNPVKGNVYRGGFGRGGYSVGS